LCYPPRLDRTSGRRKIELHFQLPLVYRDRCLNHNNYDAVQEKSLSPSPCIIIIISFLMMFLFLFLFSLLLLILFAINTLTSRPWLAPVSSSGFFCLVQKVDVDVCDAHALPSDDVKKEGNVKNEGNVKCQVLKKDIHISIFITNIQ